MPDEAGRGWLFVSIEKEQAGDGVAVAERIAEMSNVPAPPYTVVLDSDVDVKELDEALFHWLANTAPERDMLRTDHGVTFDATVKVRGDTRNNQPVRAWPPIIKMDEETKRRVDSRWRDYFPDTD